MPQIKKLNIESVWHYYYLIIFIVILLLLFNQILFYGLMIIL